MSLSTTGTGLSGAGYDPLHLLDLYRTAGEHRRLTGDRTSGPTALCGPSAFGCTGYDELIDADGNVRPAWRELAELLDERGEAGLDRLRELLRDLVDNNGITYIEVDRHGEAVTDGQGMAMPGPWHLDGIPLLLADSDWQTLEAGMTQRSRLLDAVLRDLYGERRSLTSGVLPPRLLFGHPGYLRAARGISNPGRHQLFMLACDVSRGAGGRFLVNADWTQAPSGAGYALADRRLVARSNPDVYERIRPRSASPFAQALRLALIEAAPEAAEDPVVVVLSPGIHSETAFDQAYLASVLGFPLLESDDLVVQDGKLWMRSLGTLKQVDVVFRRVDAEYADPLDLRPDSRLGVVGLVETQRRGAVSVVNSLGSGILESPGLHRFLPELSELLLGEAPLLESPQSYWAGIDAERSHLLSRLESLLIKSTVGEQTIVGPVLSAAERAELAARIEAAPWQWVGQELPQFSTAPTGHFPGGLSAAGVGLRLFTVAQRSGYAPMVGGLGYVLSAAPGAFKLNQVAAKDIWIRPPARAAAAVTVPSVKLPSGTPSISSPRVLADLFWIGRYAERSEAFARLLIVARERYHEFRNRRDVEGSECLPVLLNALDRLADADVTAGKPDDEGVRSAPHTLWSLTADRARAGSLAQSVEGLGLAARSVRDQMSNDTWMVLGVVERTLARQAESGPDDGPDAASYDDTALATAQQRTLAAMLALSGMAAESMVQDAGWTMMDIGKRIERALSLCALLRVTITAERGPVVEQNITDSVLVVCESSVIYRRRNLGQASVAAVARLLLFDGRNPRSLAFQLDRLRSDLRSLPGASGATRPERLVEEVSARLRRMDPEDLEQVDARGRRLQLDELLAEAYETLRELSDVITRTQLSLPGGMQPLWGPDQRREMP